MSLLSKLIAYIMLITSILTPHLAKSFSTPTPDSIRTADVRASIRNGEDAHIYELDNENVSFAAEDNFYYVNNIIVVFFAPGVSDFKKAEITASVNGKCVGYNNIVDQWQIEVREAPLDRLTAICEELKEYDEVLEATVDEANIVQECAIPDDPWSGASFDENNPSGKNWWIEATECLSAWDYNDYFNHIDVGVVDNGIYLEHEDLSDIELAEDYAENNRPSAHGSAVTALIGATANNQKGITGVLWNKTIHTVDVFPDSDQNFESSSMIYWGLTACVSAGAKVVNFSVGNVVYSYSVPSESTVNRNAVNASSYMSSLLNKGYDFIVVESAGNGYSDTHVSYDTKYNGYFCSINLENTGKGAEMAQKINDRIVIVGAAENLNYKSYQQAVSSTMSSCVGDNVDICAPGRSVYSLNYSDSTKNNEYASWGGTSMAAPITAGILALTWSVNPELTGADVRSIVIAEENTPYIVADNTSTLHPQEYVYRMVNAKRSVEAAIATLLADYTLVDEAIARANALDFSIYTPLSVQRVTDAIEAVDRTKTAAEQYEVDQMAEAIDYAVSMLVFRPPTIAAAEGQDVAIDRDKHIIYHINERTSREALAELLNVSNGTVEIITSSRFIGTGSVVNIYNREGELYSSYNVIIFGDIDGNGIINTSDYSALVMYFAGNNDLGDRTSPYYMAADLTGEGRVGITDVPILTAHLSASIPIIQNEIR
ncbi:MAG: S8 family serine peptidase [Clostridiales bacterium]|nr:S8 family serine peptidase [Clostridiales bacterium]